MVSGKRSSRRQRREPVRHPIPVQRLRAQPRSRPDNEGRLPQYDSPMLGKLCHVPPETLPLYACLAIVNADMAGAPANTCVPVCYQLVGALEHLGFDAEAMAAHVSITRDDGRGRPFELGVQGRPTVSADQTTNGHCVLYASSFRRFVDPTIVQAPGLLAAASDDTGFTLPVVLPVSGRDQVVDNRLSTQRAPFTLLWTCYPQWTGVFAPLLGGRVAQAMPYGRLLLAHTVVHLLQEMAQLYDLRQLHSLYPQLGALMSGRATLPPLPEEPPAAFVQIYRERSATTGTG